MARARFLLMVGLAVSVATGASAQARVSTRALTCTALKAVVARDRDVVLAASPFVYETVHVDSGRCRQDETALPAFEPTADDPSCFAGWRCVQRSNDPAEK